MSMSDDEIRKYMLEKFYTGTPVLEPFKTDVPKLDNSRLSIANGVVSYDGDLIWRGGRIIANNELPFKIDTVNGNFTFGAAFKWSSNMPSKVAGIFRMSMQKVSEITSDVEADTFQISNCAPDLKITGNITANLFEIKVRNLNSVEVVSPASLNINSLTIKSPNVVSAATILDPSAPYSITIDNCPNLSLGLVALFAGGDKIKIIGNIQQISQQYLGKGIGSLIDMIREYEKQEIDL